PTSMPYSSPTTFSADPAPTHLHPLSLHDALPISWPSGSGGGSPGTGFRSNRRAARPPRNDAGLNRLGYGLAGHSGERRAIAFRRDRKSTRLNSSHVSISYAVFCLKKKKIRNLLTD